MRPLHFLVPFSLITIVAIALSQDSTTDPKQLHAGAFVQDITAPFDSLIINGGFTERKRGKMNPGELKAR